MTPRIRNRAKRRRTNLTRRPRARPPSVRRRPVSSPPSSEISECGDSRGRRGVSRAFALDRRLRGGSSAERRSRSVAAAPSREWVALEDRLERGSGGRVRGAGEEPRRLRALVLDAISSAAADVVASNAAVARWEHRAAATEAELGETSRAGDARVSLRRRRLVLVDAANRAAELARLCEAVETFERCREPERDAAAEAALLPEGFLDFSLHEDDDDDAEKERGRVSRGRDADTDGWEEAYEATLERLVAAAEASAEGALRRRRRRRRRARARRRDVTTRARRVRGGDGANASRDAAVAAFRWTRRRFAAAAFSRAKDSADAISRAASSDVVETFATLLAHLDASLAGRSIAGGGVRGAGDVVVAAGQPPPERRIDARDWRRRSTATRKTRRRRRRASRPRRRGDVDDGGADRRGGGRRGGGVGGVGERRGRASAAAADATATRDAAETARRRATRAAAALKEEAGLGLVADGGEDGGVADGGEDGGVADGGEDGGVADDVADDEDEAEESTRESDVTSSASRAPPRARARRGVTPLARTTTPTRRASSRGGRREIGRATAPRRDASSARGDGRERRRRRGWRRASRGRVPLPETCLSETPLSPSPRTSRGSRRWPPIRILSRLCTKGGCRGCESKRRDGGAVVRGA